MRDERVTADAVQEQVVRYLVAESDTSTAASVTRLAELIGAACVNVDESLFWVAVDMMRRKILALIASGELSAPVAHQVAVVVLRAAVTRARAGMATTLGARTLRAFLDVTAKIKFQLERPVVPAILPLPDTDDPRDVLAQAMQVPLSDALSETGSLVFAAGPARDIDLPGRQADELAPHV